MIVDGLIRGEECDASEKMKSRVEHLREIKIPLLEGVAHLLVRDESIDQLTDMSSFKIPKLPTSGGLKRSKDSRIGNPMPLLENRSSSDRPTNQAFGRIEKIVDLLLC